MLVTRFKIIAKEYRDSVSLMQLSALLSARSGVQEASAVMATENNLALLAEAGFELSGSRASAADLLIVVKGEEAALAAALEQAVEHLTRQSNGAAAVTHKAPRPRSIEMAVKEAPIANLVMISTPGDYAAAEALKALQLNRNVLLFSDNVTEDDELRLKRFARERDLIVMGPDCGTAIVNGISLGFANVVERGPIGVIGASGTGLQEVTVLIDRFGLGISQAIGTGGRDLHEQIGGLSMLKALAALGADADTRVVVLISKPPSAQVAERVLTAAARVGKPVVVNFLGAERATLVRPGISPVHTLEDAARAAVALSRGEPAQYTSAEVPRPTAALPALDAKQRYIRGLYSGGTFSYEATLLLDECLAQVYSNTPVRAQQALADVWHSHHHTLIDLGDDQFTRGRPHPMIDFRLRNERIVREAQDPETAVILLDVVLGYASHADPVAELVPALRRAGAAAASQGRQVVFVGHVCGTDRDPQGFGRQTSALADAGMLLTQSNAQAVRLAAGIVAGRAPPRV